MAHTQDNKNPLRTIVVEGNIGAGKSTFLRLLKEKLQVHIVYEPLYKWESVGGGKENILDKFYKDPKRWAYTFQTYAFVTRVMEQQQHAALYKSPVHILERSVYSDRYCFAKNSFELGLMTPLEWELYQEWFSWLVDQYVLVPDGFIYLRTDPKVCYERLLKRGRKEEETVSFDYLKLLHEKHEDWLIYKKNVASAIQNVPVLVIPCDEDFEHSPEEQEKHMNAVMAFLLDGTVTNT